MVSSSFFWDPPREAFTIPFFDIEIYWYSVLFAAGFLAAYFVVLSFVKRQLHSSASRYTDTLAWYIFFGMLIGARLGHVFFYDWDYFREHPSEIVMLRRGGLASHGATAGIIASLFLFSWRHKELSFLKLFDYLSVAAPLAGAFVRIGNFFNQEIQGTPTTLPWGVVFGHPADGVTVACHPAQLYEALFYIFLFAILFYIMRKCEGKIGDGRIAGAFLIALFAFRFGIEWLKVPQEAHPNDQNSSDLNMGQLLSLPFIATGLYLLLRKK